MKVKFEYWGNWKSFWTVIVPFISPTGSVVEHYRLKRTNPMCISHRWQIRRTAMILRTCCLHMAFGSALTFPLVCGKSLVLVTCPHETQFTNREDGSQTPINPSPSHLFLRREREREIVSTPSSPLFPSFKTLEFLRSRSRRIQPSPIADFSNSGLFFQVSSVSSIPIDWSVFSLCRLMKSRWKREGLLVFST